jgi:hypothetical protein
MSAPLPDLILYAREGCHLCAESKALILDLLGDRAARGLPVPRLVERDIDTDPDWQRAFFTTIPVVELGDRRLELALSAARLRRLLADQLDGVPT